MTDAKHQEDIGMTVLPQQVRAQRLRALRADKTKAVGSEKIFYKGRPERFDVFPIPLDLLIYNRHNGRIESEMLTWEFEHDVGHQEYTEEINKKIDEFLWNTNVERNKHTLKDLEEKEQQRPGIVSLDGVVIDGNRRKMLLSRIGGGRHFDAVILPDEYYENEKEIVRLETEYQIGEDSKLDYGPLEKYLKVKRLEGLGYVKQDIVKMMGVGNGEFDRLHGTMALMDDYLAYIECPGLYNMLKERDGSTKEGMFVDLYSDLKRLQDGASGIDWPVDGIDITELRTTQFDYIRYGTELFESGKDYRSISHKDRGLKTIFAKQHLWKPFRTEHTKNIDQVTMGMGSLDDYMRAHPQQTSRAGAAELRDDEWKGKVEGVLFGNFNRSNSKLESENYANMPRELLERALDALEPIDYEAPTFTADGSNLGLVDKISNLIWLMKKRFKKPGG